MIMDYLITACLLFFTYYVVRASMKHSNYAKIESNKAEREETYIERKGL